MRSQQAIIEAKALVATDETAYDNLDEDDGDIEDDDDIMDDNEKLVVDFLEEMTFGPDDDIPPYKSNQSFILELIDRICCPPFEDYTVSY